jgi:hypothetical protein
MFLLVNLSLFTLAPAQNSFLLDVMKAELLLTLGKQKQDTPNLKILQLQPLALFTLFPSVSHY